MDKQERVQALETEMKLGQIESAGAELRSLGKEDAISQLPQGTVWIYKGERRDVYFAY